jgi:hypothetical protein
VMVDILEVFRQHPDKFFVLVTAPPKKQAGMTYGENARATADWMVDEWLDGYEVGNVMVFDLFNVLTSNAEGEGDACQQWETYPLDPASASDVELGTGNHHRVWGGQVQHQVGYAQTYSAYCNSHPGKGATYKMTRELVPLLNAYDNAWVAREIPSLEPTDTPTQVARVTPTTPPMPSATIAQTPSATPKVATPTVTNTPLPTTVPDTDEQQGDAGVVEGGGAVQCVLVGGGVVFLFIVVVSAWLRQARKH